MTVIDLVVGLSSVAVTAAGYAAGWFARARVARLEKPALVCVCGHVASFHKNGGNGPCQYAQEKMQAREWRQYACPCQRYIGPDPMAAGYLPIGS